MRVDTMNPTGRVPRVVIVGGGIAGLAAAWELVHGRAEDDPTPEVHVLEASGRFGGKLHTSELAGHLVDEGADAFLARAPHGTTLARELGLADALVSPATRSASVVHHDRLVPLPRGLVLGIPTDLEALRDHGLVSDAGIERAARDLEQPATPLDHDVAVGPFVRDRLGDEVYTTLVAPLLGGVNAGDPDRLSLRAGAAAIAAAARHGSLIRGARAQLANAPDESTPVFHSLEGGTGQLVSALVDALRGRGVGLHRRAPVHGIDRGTTDRRWVVTAGGSTGPIDADVVILAAPAWVSSDLVRPHGPEVAADLAALDYASVAVIRVVVPRDRLEQEPEGSGFLVPDGSDRIVTACSFGHQKWPHWADDGTAVLRISVGRHHDARGLALDDATLVTTALDEIAPLLGVTGPPTETQVVRWPRALPQYRPGHLDRMARWDESLGSEAPGIGLVGAATAGIGIPACIERARTVARSLGDVWT